MVEEIVVHATVVGLDDTVTRVFGTGSGTHFCSCAHSVDVRGHGKDLDDHGVFTVRRYLTFQVVLDESA